MTNRTPLLVFSMLWVSWMCLTPEHASSGSKAKSWNTEIIRDCPVCPPLLDIKKRSSASNVLGFLLGVRLISVGEWKACVIDGWCRQVRGIQYSNSERPIEGVSWSDAVQYTNWLSSRTGRGYRLTTEEEWELIVRVLTELIKLKPASPESEMARLDETFAEWINDCWLGGHQTRGSGTTDRIKKDCKFHVARKIVSKSNVGAVRRYKYHTNKRQRKLGFRIARDRR